MRLAPAAHRLEEWPQRLTLRSDRVHHARWRVWMDSALDDARHLQLAELLRERPLCNAWNRALKFRKPFGALK